MKATAIAHPMQGLIKYHGLRNEKLRIPFHDSISVNIDKLWTKTTVEFGDYEQDKININETEIYGLAKQRAIEVLNIIRKLSGIKLHAKIKSIDNISQFNAKGLGSSSSGGAALAAAAFKAARLDKEFGWDLKLISTIARRLAGSACRSVIGEYSRWNSGTNNEDSYAYKIAKRKNLDISILIVPLYTKYVTDRAHKEVLTSSFFNTRIENINERIKDMENAIKNGDLNKVGKLSELDSLELHSVTMTGKNRHILFTPESIKVIKEVQKLREERIPAYFSMQTGPSVFIDTYHEYSEEIEDRIKKMSLPVIKSKVGEGVKIIS